MTTAYSRDLRERILKDDDAGVPVEDLVQHYDMSRSWSMVSSSNAERPATLLPGTGLY